MYKRQIVDDLHKSLAAAQSLIIVDLVELLRRLFAWTGRCCSTSYQYWPTGSVDREFDDINLGMFSAMGGLAQPSHHP